MTDADRTDFEEELIDITGGACDLTRSAGCYNDEQTEQCYQVWIAAKGDEG